MGKESDELTHTVVVVLAGVAVHIRSNSPAVTAAFVERYGLDRAPENDAPKCDYAIRVTQRNLKVPVDAEAYWEDSGPDHTSAFGPGFSAELDLAAGTAKAEVDETLVRGHRVFRRAVLEGIPLTIINRRDRHPVHAASVREGRAGLLLVGSSGVGKSTLAYVANRAGIDVLADDATRVQLTPELRVWGESTRPVLHLLAEARDDFADLRDLEPDWLSAGGLTKLSVQARSSSGTQLPYASAVRVCLLSRDDSPVSRRVATAEEICDRLLNAPEAAADRSREQRVRVATALGRAGGWHLKLSADPASAVPQLREMLALTRDS